MEPKDLKTISEQIPNSLDQVILKIYSVSQKIQEI